ncbi:cytochrome P450 [Rhodococcus sp. USK13]|uniref:cytochrome P450 n=1 Tax=Rhodococcus sp. USK13 TaxID=2806442 RepID=UPI001BCD8B7F|nr:cytochrome P450 [Rhodococcus sp. USK13]
MIDLGDDIIVSRHADVRAVLGDTETFSSARDRTIYGGGPVSTLSDEQRAKLYELADFESGWMNDTDDPVHAGLRDVVQFAFTPRRIAAMRDLIQSFVDELLMPADERGAIELIEELAFPLPLNAVCAILGIGRERNADIRAWSDELATAFDTGHTNLDAAYAAYTNFRGLVSEIVAEKRSSGDSTDLFGALLNSNPNGTRLTEKQLTGMLVLMLFAGHETTTNLIGNSVIALLRNPTELERLRSNPSLAAGAVHEFLRHNGSVQSVRRVARRNGVVAGHPVAQGRSVRLLLAAANRDEAVFTDPDRLDIQRANAAQHVGLGYGIHRCLGAWLARMETEIAVTTLVTRYPGMKLLAPVEFKPTFTMHGPKRLHLSLR